MRGTEGVVRVARVAVCRCRGVEAHRGVLAHRGVVGGAGVGRVVGAAGGVGVVPAPAVDGARPGTVPLPLVGAGRDGHVAHHRHNHAPLQDDDTEQEQGELPDALHGRPPLMTHQYHNAHQKEYSDSRGGATVRFYSLVSMMLLINYRKNILIFFAQKVKP